MKFNTRLTVEQLLQELKKYNHRELHVHHTWKPNYTSFYQTDSSGKRRYSAEQLNENMKTYHTKPGTFNPRATDIAQHITTFPDGTILSGRQFNRTPISIAGRNTGAFCVEQVGDFDLMKDIMTVEQRNVILVLIDFFLKRGKKVVFHNEYSSKTCPGTAIDKAGLLDASNYYLRWKVMRKGLFGTDVLNLQKLLDEKGYPIKWKDGVFGKDTDDAVRAFQADNGLTVDGSVGEDTLNKLKGLTTKPPVTKPPVTVPPVTSATTLRQFEDLYIMENSIDKLYMAHIGKTLPSVGATGINGGVFSFQDNSPTGIWHIAIVNGKPLGPNALTNDYHGRYKRATIIMMDDVVTVEYICHITDSKRIKSLADVSRIQFAIGGFGNLSLPWLELDHEQIPRGDRNPARRTAIVFKQGRVYMIATKKAMTYQTLHKMVHRAIPGLEQAVALDGGGSTQMFHNKTAIVSSSRKVADGLFFKN